MLVIFQLQVQSVNQMVLHTKEGCYMAVPGQFTGTPGSTSCGPSSGGAGCSIRDTKARGTFGQDFNARESRLLLPSFRTLPAASNANCAWPEQRAAAFSRCSGTATGSRSGPGQQVRPFRPISMLGTRCPSPGARQPVPGRPTRVIHTSTSSSTDSSSTSPSVGIGPAMEGRIRRRVALAPASSRS